MHCMFFFSIWVNKLLLKKELGSEWHLSKQWRSLFYVSWAVSPSTPTPPTSHHLSDQWWFSFVYFNISFHTTTTTCTTASYTTSHTSTTILIITNTVFCLTCNETPILASSLYSSWLPPKLASAHQVPNKHPLTKNVSPLWQNFH